MYLISTGMVCPVGLYSEAACAAMRAGIDGFAELPYRDDASEAIIGATVPGIDPELKRETRLIQLLDPAIRECVTGVDPKLLVEMPLLIGLAEQERLEDGISIVDRIIPEIERRIGIKFLKGYSRVIPTGRTAGFEALREARGLFQTLGVGACLVCGVDSYANAHALHWLDLHWRLKKEGNSDGVIPGEAAAAVILRSQPGMNPTEPVRIIGLGFSTEKATIMTEDPPLLSLGLTEASKSALSEAHIQMHEVGLRLSDITGESYGFREQSLAFAKLLRDHRIKESPLWHCAEFLGDTGAAVGVIQLIMAFYAYQKGYAPGEIAMCFTSGDKERRAVALLSNIPKAMRRHGA